MIDFSKAVEDHPRGCGEHHPQDRVLPDLRGSSPRMRGALKNAVKQKEILGIIPADAGSTNRPDLVIHPVEDHPRGCGEHFAPWSCSHW